MQHDHALGVAGGLGIQKVAQEVFIQVHAVQEA